MYCGSCHYQLCALNIADILFDKIFMCSNDRCGQFGVQMRLKSIYMANVEGIDGEKFG
jgi:hypothetical protein